jgi:hypothetical protein
MKAITLHQPWASLMAIGAKRIETRSWATSYRGPLAIHAAKTMPAYAKQFCYERAAALGPLLGWERQGGLGLGWDVEAGIAALPLGAIVATVRLIDCVAAEILTGAVVAPRLIRSHAAEAWDTTSLTERERGFGDYSEGRFGWITDRRAMVDPPIAIAEKQGLWEIAPLLDSRGSENAGGEIARSTEPECGGR